MCVMLEELSFCTALFEIALVCVPVCVLFVHAHLYICVSMCICVDLYLRGCVLMCVSPTALEPVQSWIGSPAGGGGECRGAGIAGEGATHLRPQVNQLSC